MAHGPWYGVVRHRACEGGGDILPERPRPAGEGLPGKACRGRPAGVRLRSRPGWAQRASGTLVPWYP